MINKNINIAVLGLGYVGLPLALKLSKNFTVIGYDTNNARVKSLCKYFDTNRDINKLELKRAISSKKLYCTSVSVHLESCNVFIITVPTPVYKNKNPNLAYVINAAKLISKFVKKNTLVIAESTFYPGTTEEVIKNIIEKTSNLISPKDFGIGYSPERINPGDKIHTIDKITKVISANSKKYINLMKKIYGSINNGKIFIAKSIKVAEASKVIENTQRDLNIAFVNELNIICEKLDININDVLEASKTKWNFLNFTPGLVGGHCIGVDPYYLMFKSNKLNYTPKLIKNSRRINDGYFKFLAKKFNKIVLSKDLKKVKINILLMGYTFKKNVADTRNTQIEELRKLLDANPNYNVYVFDPFINTDIYKKNFFNKQSDIKMKFHSIIYLVNHDLFFKQKRNNFFKIFLKKNGFICDVTNSLTNIGSFAL